MEDTHLSVPTTDATAITFWSYWPIVLMYVLAAVLALFTVQLTAHPDYMSHVMGFVLILFGLIKLTDISGFAAGFTLYDPLAKMSVTYARVYPFIELVLGGLFIFQLLVLPATLLTLVIYMASLWGALRSVRNKELLHCMCLGTYFRLPLSTVTILEAGFMISMCVWMLLMFDSMAGMAM